MNSYYVGVGPTSVTNVSGFRLNDWKLPVTYNYSAGIQREIGFQTVLDVSYVGSKT
jgi:hypothetical protein